MADQSDVLRHVVGVLERCEIGYLLVGSWASGLYGEPRFTQDIDFVLELPRDKVGMIYAAFGPPRYYLSREALLEAVRDRGFFNIIHNETGVKVDFNVARGTAFARGVLARRRRARILPDLEGWVASPEDIILSKMQFYAEGGSEKHLRDIAGILQVQDDSLDRIYVVRWAAELGVLETWQAILKRVDR